MNQYPRVLSPKSRKNRSGTSLSHLDKFDVRLDIKSHFSDDENENNEDKEVDILKLAKKIDRLQSSRQTLIIKMSGSTRAMTMGQQAEVKAALSLQTKQTSFKDTNEISLVSATSPNQAQNDYIESEGSENCNDIDCHANIPPYFARGSRNSNYLPKPEVEPPAQIMPSMKFKSTSKVLSSQNPAKELPMIEGFLSKKGTNFLGLWQRRYFVLKDKKLYYYQTQAKELRLGVIDFDLLSVKLQEGSSVREIKIIPIGGTRIFLLRAQGDEEGKKWFAGIEKHVQASKGYSCSLCKVVKMKKYWKDERISEEKFLQMAETGDIILFRTKNIGAKIQRSFTGSEYDHVGLILKYNNGEIVLFEATGKEGVGLCTWRNFVKNKWHLLYHKMVYRKLMIDRSKEVMKNIEKFVRFSRGKKYNISAKKLLKKKSTTFADDENRTFFCSELVASCYKKLSLLPKEISAANYLPGAFSAERKLELLNNAKLGEELLIEFEI